MQSQSGSQSTPDAAKVNPQFLKANASVHTWVFSAIAELIDNAYDANAQNLDIDVVEMHDVKCLKFSDNGIGMDRDDLFKMLSFGFTTEYSTGNKLQIGKNGIGFKSGVMRLGDDALVFTRCMERASVGFLSLSYLTDFEADSVLVPILEYTWPNQNVERDNFAKNLEIILKYSPFEDEEELKEELLTQGKQGTTIYVFGLTKSEDEKELELDFYSSPRDIQCFHDDSTPEHKYSLRKYCSILFLQPKMKIKLRDVTVKTEMIGTSMQNTRSYGYKAHRGKREIKVTFGLRREDSQDYGMMLYHRNRLIMPFEKLPCQKQVPNPRGVGVIGFANVNFLTPIHIKQDFIREDKKFENAMRAFNDKLKQYVQDVLEGAAESHPLSHCDAEQESTSKNEEVTPNETKSPQKRGAKSSAKEMPTSRVGSGGNKADQQQRSPSSGAGPSTGQRTRASEKAGPSRRQDDDDDDNDNDDSFSQAAVHVRESVNKSRGKSGKRKSTSTHERKEPSSNMASPAKCYRVSNQGTSKQADSMQDSIQSQTIQVLTRQLHDTKRQLDDITKQLRGTKKQLDDRTRQLDDRTMQLDDTKRQLDDRTRQLDDITKQLDDTERQLDDRTRQLDDITKQLDDTKRQLDDRTKQLDELHQKIRHLIG